MDINFEYVIQEFISTLSEQQCHELIIQAYGKSGGMELAKGILNISLWVVHKHPPVVKTLHLMHHGGYVANADPWIT